MPVLIVLLAWPVSDLPSKSTDAAALEHARLREREIAQSHRTIEEFGGREMLLGLDGRYDELVALARAYNEVSDHLKALGAISQIPECWLAEQGELESTLVYYYNVNSPYIDDGIGQGDFDGTRELGKAAEFEFIQRCLDRGHGDRGRMLLHKASFLCRSCAGRSFSRFSGWYDVVTDRNRYEQSFVVLERALEVEPRLVREIRFLSPFQFPVLDEEDRFVRLLERTRERVHELQQRSEK